MHVERHIHGGKRESPCGHLSATSPRLLPADGRPSIYPGARQPAPFRKVLAASCKLSSMPPPSLARFDAMRSGPPVWFNTSWGTRSSPMSASVYRPPF